MKQDISFDSHGARCAAWLFLPSGEGPFPIIVMAHGLAAVKEMRLDAYAERFREAGYACLVFDYRHFGESEGEPRQLLSIKRQHQDWMAAIAYARQIPEVDARKVVLWGTSLSGGHVLEVAARLPEIAAVIAQVPHLSAAASLGLNSVKTMLALTLHGLYDALRGLLGLSPHYILSSAEPGELAVMTAPGESNGYLQLVPAGQNFDRRIAARFAVSVGGYSPVNALKKLDMPVLIQAARRDVTTPAQPAIDACPKYANVELKLYDTGHFQPYLEPVFSEIVADQLAFLGTQAHLKTQ